MYNQEVSINTALLTSMQEINISFYRTSIFDPQTSHAVRGQVRLLPNLTSTHHFRPWNPSCSNAHIVARPQVIAIELTEST